MTPLLFFILVNVGMLALLVSIVLLYLRKREKKLGAWLSVLVYTAFFVWTGVTFFDLYKYEMNQIHVFILVNILPVLTFIIVGLFYLRMQKRRKRDFIPVLVCALFAVWATYISFDVHAKLFPSNKVLECYTPKPGEFYATTAHPHGPGIYNSIFNVRMKFRTRPICGGIKR